MRDTILSWTKAHCSATLHAQIEEILMTPLHRNLFFLCIVVRAILLAPSTFAVNNLDYEDIDYTVYTDGTHYVLQGGSPYDRITYRYTPLISWLAIPNVLLFRNFGKLLFCFIDLLNIILTRELIETETGHRMGLPLHAINCFNILPGYASTRGSFENMVSFIVFLSVYLIMKRRYVLAALLHGFSVHLKIYPIIFSVPIYLFIERDRLRSNTWIGDIVNANFFNRKRIMFGLVSAGTLLFFTVFFYALYGQIFLDEGYIYHLTRIDHKNNFSIFYYFEYFHYWDIATGSPYLLRKLGGLFQWGITLAAGLILHRDIFLAFYVQSCLFVHYNRVLTAQYFNWYQCFFPIIFARSYWWQGWKKLMILAMTISWLYVEININILMGDIEGRGKANFEQIHIWNLGFYALNLVHVSLFIFGHKFQQTPYFDELEEPKDHTKND